MTDADRTAFVTLMAKLAAVYREALTDALLEAYWEALRDYELEYLEPAAAYVIRTSKWFPKPVELREAASQFRVEARRKALGPGLRLALGEKALTVDEVKAFLEELRARPEHAEALAEIPKKGVSELQAEARRLDAIGARDMTDEKRQALAQFRRYQDTGC
jgi:hypothetical protein